MFYKLSPQTPPPPHQKSAKNADFYHPLRGFYVYISNHPHGTWNSLSLLFFVEKGLKQIFSLPVYSARILRGHPLIPLRGVDRF